VVVREVASGRSRWKRQSVPGQDRGLGPAVALSPDGRLLAVPVDETVHVFDLASDRLVRSFRGDMGCVSCVAFSPDGRLLATGQDVPGVLLWDVSRLAAPLRRRDVTPQALARLWADLLDPDAAVAFRAIWALAAAPDRAVPFLRLRLVPDRTEEAFEREARGLIADLDSRHFPTRQTAEGSLRQMGKRAGSLLREARNRPVSAEVAKRLDELLDRLKAGLSDEELQIVRAVEALERSGTKEAQALLAELAAGRAGDITTDEATAALKRVRATR
jgi:hypothetical protein